MPLTFFVLGLLEVQGPAGGAKLTSARQRAILAMLLMNANRPVPVGRLIDAVWEGDPPRTAREQILICVSNLRRSLTEVGLPGRIVTRSPGYLIMVAPGELDLQVFDQHVMVGSELAHRDGYTAESAAVLRRGLRLFTGEPFSDVDSPLVRTLAGRVTERRITVTERCIEVEVRLGRLDDALDELAPLIAEYPLRGRLRSLKMTALRRAGRKAEALAVYREMRQELADELGVEPDAELQYLQRDILREGVDARPPQGRGPGQPGPIGG
jgi:DNA-binding SARP family transcriptional activator